MGAVGTHVRRAAVVSGPAGGRRRASGVHPLLELHRTVGNRAVTALVQRRTGTSTHISAVALATADRIYEGKCDAILKGAHVRLKWSRGLLGKDVSIIFECGPQSFEFSTFIPHFDDRFPWGLELVGGGSAWVTTPISDALDNIRADIDDPGAKFWGGYHAIVERLTWDLKAYCRD